MDRRTEQARLLAREHNARLGALLLQALEESGLTQVRLGELLGVSPKDVARWVRGEYLVPALLAFDARLPQSFRARLSAKWEPEARAALARSEQAVLVSLTDASSALARHLLESSVAANDNGSAPAPAPPVRAIATAHDVLADYLRARRAA